MDVHVVVTVTGPDEPPPGTPVLVEIRDTSLLDVPSTTVSTAQAVAGATDPAGAQVPGHTVLAEVDLAVPDDVSQQAMLTVWARVATTDHEHVTSGDWITVQAYPLESSPVRHRSDGETIVVEVVQV